MTPPGDAAGIRLSLVIPAYNEAALLPRLLDSIELARGRWRPGAVEILVADNGSTDATAQIAAARGCRVVAVEQRCIAAARNGGAAAATGEWLGFVDADSMIRPETFAAIEQALSDSAVVGGATGVTMERWSPGIALTYAAMLPMVWLTGMDTGVVFCRRADFEALGGYDEARLIAEDVDFLWRLKRLGRARGQSLRRLREVKAITSTRKFDRYGDWHYFTCMPVEAVRLLRHGRGALTGFAQRYWYQDR